MRKLSSSIFLSFCLLASRARCDLPIMCPKSGSGIQYAGQTWTFHVAAQGQEVSLFSAQEVCTHSVPNRIQSLGSYEFSIPSEVVYKIKMVDEESVVAGECQGKGGSC